MVCNPTAFATRIEDRTRTAASGHLTRPDVQTDRTRCGRGDSHAYQGGFHPPDDRTGQ